MVMSATGEAEQSEGEGREVGERSVKLRAPLTCCNSTRFSLYFYAESVAQQDAAPRDSSFKAIISPHSSTGQSTGFLNLESRFESP